jgi:hypothetical protein
MRTEQSRSVFSAGHASLDFPLSRPIQAHYGGGEIDAFVAKISSQ